MIKTFASKAGYEFFLTGKSKHLPADIVRRALRKLEYVHLVTNIDDLKVPPGNRLHELKDDRAGFYSISINDKWRICFRFIEGNAYDVEIVDYH
jgi:toxin HigB-1